MANASIKKFLKDVAQALDAYFNAEGDMQGKSDSDAVYDIIKHHVTYIELSNRKSGFMPEEDIEQRIGIVDTDEGINVAYDFASHFDLGMLETLDPLARIELLEACIYALNSRINEVELDCKKRRHERREGQ